MSFERAYEGLRVIDMSQGVAGPYCAMLLAQHGADVIKVEPLSGDWARLLGPGYGEHTAYSIATNLGKRSIALDLKGDKGRAIIDKLLPTADVFIEGFRPGVIDRLGYSCERLSEINSKLVYVSISGFGQTGPLAQKPAMDPVAQAFTGFMSENKGADGVPLRSPTVIFDMATALYAQQAVAAALYAVKDGARGRRICISLMEAAANLQSIRLMSSYRDGDYKVTGAPLGTFKTADGWLQIMIVKDREFASLCKALQLDDLVKDARFQSVRDRVGHAGFLNDEVAKVLLTRPAAEWRDKLTAAGLQNEVVQSYRDFIEHPQTEATGLISKLQQSGSVEPWPVPNPPGVPRLEQGTAAATAPDLGEHTRSILAQSGWSEQEITDLAAEGVIFG